MGPADLVDPVGSVGTSAGADPAVVAVLAAADSAGVPIAIAARGVTGVPVVRGRVRVDRVDRVPVREGARPGATVLRSVAAVRADLVGVTAVIAARGGSSSKNRCPRASRSI